MYAVYGPPENKMIYGPVPALGDAQAYVDECRIVCDTGDWVILPVEIMSPEKPTGE